MVGIVSVYSEEQLVRVSISYRYTYTLLFGHAAPCCGTIYALVPADRRRSNRIQEDRICQGDMLTFINGVQCAAGGGPDRFERRKIGYRCSLIAPIDGRL